MNRFLFSLLTAVVVAFGADDPWAKVRELKSGTELRIYKRGTAEPVMATMQEATEERVVILLKRELTSVRRVDIDRLDQRPRTRQRVTTQTSAVIRAAGNPARSEERIGSSATPSSTSTMGTLTINSKPEFETVYRRPPSRYPN